MVQGLDVLGESFAAHESVVLREVLVDELVHNWRVLVKGSELRVGGDGLFLGGGCGGFGSFFVVDDL